MSAIVQDARVAIIGGGCVGLSVAFHLARIGVDGVVALEKEPIVGSCSTALGVGGIRRQFSTSINISLSLESIEEFLNFEKATGTPLDFRETGYLFTASSDAAFERLKRNVNFQNSRGVDSILLTRDELSDRWPCFETSDIMGAAFCSRDGVADPHTVAQGYAIAARQAGVRILESAEVIGIERESGKAKGVKTSGGTIKADKVLIASGAWSGVVASTAGESIPIAPLRRVCFSTGETPMLPANLPFSIDSDSGFWIRREGTGAIMGIPNAAEKPGSFDASIDWSLREKATEAGLKRIPSLVGASINKAWAGLYEMTPDNHPVIGEFSDCRGLFIAAGFSGHGFMHSPAAGIHTAELLAGVEPSLDISMLSPQRFKDGLLIKEDIWI